MKNVYLKEYFEEGLGNILFMPYYRILKDINNSFIRNILITIHIIFYVLFTLIFSYFFFKIIFPF